MRRREDGERGTSKSTGWSDRVESSVKRDVKKAGEEEDWKNKTRDRGREEGGRDYQTRW